ncbi:MAG: hypothetical protein ACXVI3_04390 [Halobacteriota archaeon]
MKFISEGAFEPGVSWTSAGGTTIREVLLLTAALLCDLLWVVGGCIIHSRVAGRLQALDCSSDNTVRLRGGVLQLRY